MINERLLMTGTMTFADILAEQRPLTKTPTGVGLVEVEVACMGLRHALSLAR